MQLLHPRRHRSLVPQHLALAREQAALQRELDLGPRVVHHGANDKQAVAASRAPVAGGVAAPHRDGRGRLFHNLEVVRDAGPLVVRAPGELLPGPQLRARLGAAVLPLEIAALSLEA